MDVIGTLRQQMQEGRIGAEPLIDLMASQQRQFHTAQQQLLATQQLLEAVLQHLPAARQRSEELEKKHGILPPTAKPDQAFSMRAEEQLSEKARVLWFGVHKDTATLPALLNPQTFAGIVMSDDAAVYENVTAAQKCWAQLVRKGVKLTLQDPNNRDYRHLADRLLEIYREACRIQRDQRFSATGRVEKVAALDDEVFALCGSVRFAERSELDDLDNDHRRLVAEVFRLMMAKQLFTFVTAPPVQQPNGPTQPVAGTNYEAEPSLRHPAQARVTGGTNKTSNGARRQSVLTSVLESLCVDLPTDTLASVVEELMRWATTGRSCFERLLKKLKLTPRQETKPLLDQILPSPQPTAIPMG
jgi:transposase